MKNIPNNPRAAAAFIISHVEKGSSLTTSLLKYGTSITKTQQALLYQLCYGTLRHYFMLCDARRYFLKTPLKKKDAIVNALILIGLYQLFFLQIPPYAIIKETVDAAAALYFPWAKGLLNAILRKAEQQKDTLSFKNIASFNHNNHPHWLLQLYQKQWPQHWQHIVHASNEKAPMTLRVNQQKKSRHEYLIELKKQGILATETEISPVGIHLHTACSVSQLPGFESGWVSVQDEASQLSALLLQCQPHESILEIGAAPGGKTGHLLESVPSIKLVAVDKEQERLTLLQQNLTRLQLKAQRLICADVTSYSWAHDNPFDRILIDAPCSATGVIRRHPDIKLLRRPDDILSYTTLQESILNKVWPLLKPGGTLVYATCSLLQEENTLQIKRFLCQHQNAALSLTKNWSLLAPSIVQNKNTYGIQLFPRSHGHDGFFYSVIKKNDIA